jgi:hypothetical protein
LLVADGLDLNRGLVLINIIRDAEVADAEFPFRQLVRAKLLAIARLVRGRSGSCLWIAAMICCWSNFRSNRRSSTASGVNSIRNMIHLCRGTTRDFQLGDIIPHRRSYVREGLIPANDLGNAFHLALLVTWNCKHLASANKFEHIHVLNALRRLLSPLLVTPEQLLEMPP